MKVRLVVVGPVTGAVGRAVSEYEARAERYWKLEVVEVEGGAPEGAADAERVKEAEAKRIRRRIPEDADLWALTRTGRLVTSTGLAKLLGDRLVRGEGDLAMVIGGAFGLDEGLLAEARRRLSLGAMTLPHELARLVLTEQLYRAGTILRNEPYHKGES